MTYPMLSTVKIAFFVVLLSTLCACQRASKELIGEWRVDQEAIASDPTLLKVAPPVGPMIRAWKMNMTKEWSFLFRKDRGIEMMMNGSHFEGRYQITREVGNTLYIRVEIKALAINSLDALLGITQPKSDVKVKRFSIRILGEEGTLKIEDFAPLKLRRQPMRG
jgi:hypothetical protein